MLEGRFAQIMEALSILLIVLGIVCLCQGVFFPLYQNGFTLLVFGWLGLNIWIHRKPVLPKSAQGNPQVTIDGRPPLDVTVSGYHPKK